VRDVTILPKSNDAISPKLGFIYPYAVDIPLSSYLLHQNSKRHLEASLDKQTGQLIGSNDEIRGAVAAGLHHARESLSKIDRHLEQSNEYLSEMSSSLNEISSNIELIEGGIGRIDDGIQRIDEGIGELTISVRTVGENVVSAIDRVSGQLSELNHTALNIGNMLRDSEFTWAHEQARTAVRAMRVRDLQTAESSAMRALAGTVNHVGAPTHVEFMLLLTEILIQQGPSRLSDAQSWMERSGQYLALEPSEELQGRFRFAKVSYLLLRGEAEGNVEDIQMAKSEFSEARKLKPFQTAGAIYQAIAETALAAPVGEIAETLIAAIMPRYQSAIEIWRLRGTGLSSAAVDLAIDLATKQFYKKCELATSPTVAVARIKTALDRIGEGHHVSHEFSEQRRHLNDLLTTTESYDKVRDERISFNRLLAAVKLNRETEKYKASIVETQKSLKG
jgi:archaellum component FlaC